MFVCNSVLRKFSSHYIRFAGFEELYNIFYRAFLLYWTMIVDCEHNKGSMFATGPCDFCRNRLDGFKRTGNKQSRLPCYTQNDNEQHKTRTFSVKWAEQPLIIPDVEKLTFTPGITKGCKPILKHRASCIVMVHDS